MYKQGLNVVAGVFLHVMPEPDAFECFSTLVLKWLPRYYVGNVRGAYDGLHLVPFCLHEVDPVLFAHLSQNGFCYETLLEFVVSLGASTPPLGETLKLWDFLFAFGFQMVPLIPVAHLVIERTRLLSGTTPGFNSRSTSLNAKVVCDLMCVFAKTLSPGLWEMLIHHTYDPEYHKDMEAYTRYLGFDSKT